MDKAEAASLCKDILDINNDIGVVIIVSYPSGEVQAIESRIPRGSHTIRRHFGVLAAIMRDHIANFEEYYGKLNHFIFSFERGQSIIYLIDGGIVVVGTSPNADPEIINEVAKRLKGL
ncbi:MAG: hypothetical protein M1503_07820 [Thaumarchaeota archaeon]|nr:hypothetical protein [Nitrososphaerota archaeon]MCL5318150.1 hypothetical protein [Nitrososphaerota archaeon]